MKESLLNGPQTDPSLRPGAKRRLAHLALAAAVVVPSAVAVESGVAGRAADAIANRVLGKGVDAPSDYEDNKVEYPKPDAYVDAEGQSVDPEEIPTLPAIPEGRG